MDARVAACAAARRRSAESCTELPSDINLLAEFSRAGMEEISEEIVGFRVDRPDLEAKIREKLTETRLVNLTGLPGCGKSAMLKRVASQATAKGPFLFLKSDRLEGKSWLTFAGALNLEHRAIGDLFAEIGTVGTPVLFIDGIDRVRPDQRGVVSDILRALESEERLANWKILATSRDQGLEPYRTWFPHSFYGGAGIGDVPIVPFTPDEADALADKMPNLRPLLFGAAGVREIARRPFFAAVLARSFPDGTPSPRTEVDLIKAWWDRAGHDAPREAVPLRQRALLDLAERGVRNLGKKTPARLLKDGTFAQVPGLKTDLVIRDHDGGASFSFTHDIFFEWVFYRRLIELDDEWKSALLEAGEPPLLGRVVGLLAQSMFGTNGRWSQGYRELETGSLRPQWRREWLTAPPFSPSFAQEQQEFQVLLSENNWALLEKLLVCFRRSTRSRVRSYFRMRTPRSRDSIASEWPTWSVGRPTSRAGGVCLIGFYRLRPAFHHVCFPTCSKFSASGKTLSPNSGTIAQRKLSRSPAAG
jgi:ATPase family associated with various cellular activities (AAA)